jgi:hypothetical protein
MRYLYGVMVLVLSGAASLAQAASMSMAWDATTSPAGFAILRCTVPAGASMCTPGTDLPGMPIEGKWRSYIDTTAAGHQCWAVKSVDASGARSAAGMATDGVTPYLCKQQPVGGTTLPSAGPITIQSISNGLRILWSHPTFDATTVPPSTLTGYEVWRRADPQTPSKGWVRLSAVASTVTTWDDPSPFVGGNCYQVRALYGTLGYKENDATCATFAAAPLLPPTNLREVLPSHDPAKAGKTR